MPTVTLPDDPTPEILDAIKAAMFAPLGGKTRAQVIYRAVLRVTAAPEAATVWLVEGAGRVVEPTSHTLTANSENEIGKAVKALHGDGFPDIKVKAEQVPA
jgi:hypothetical protein